MNTEKSGIGIDAEQVRQALLGEIDAFIEKHHISSRKFGLLVSSNSKLIKQLKERNIRIGTIKKIRDWMISYGQDGQEGKKQ